MKEMIFKIIHGPIELEPVYQLEVEYSKLAEENEKELFFTFLKDFATFGTQKEKFISLNAIILIGKAIECEDVIRQTIEIVDENENKKLISPLLTLCAVLSKDWSIDFILKILNDFKPKSNEYSYYFDISLRSIVETQHWRTAIEEIKWAIKNYENDFVVDFIAYFRWKQGEVQESELLKLFKNENEIMAKINMLKEKIEIRYNTHYLRIRKNT